MTTLPAPETALTAQLTHAPTPVAPTVPEYVFATQSIQLAFPVTFLYFPAAQSTHKPPFGPLAPALQVHALIDELDDCEIEFNGQEEHAV